MKFKKVIIKNFLSFGNQPEEINLNTGKVIHIVGNNAAGKSSIANAITFALFGKGLKNLKKNELVNNINKKDCEVQLFFEKNGIEYHIIRGIAPNKLEIYKNKQLIDQSSKVLEYQYLLENDILQMPYDLFTQLIILSGAHFVPFFRMKNTARKKFLEDLLSLNELSLMEKIVKGHLLDIKNKKNEAISALSEVNTSIKHQAEILKKTKQDEEKQKTAKQEEIEKINTEIEKLQSTKKELINTINSLNKDEILVLSEKLNKKQQEIKTSITKLITEKDSIEKGLSYITKNTKCSLCKQDISEEYKHKILDETKPIIVKLINEEQSYKKDLQEIESKLNELHIKLSEYEAIQNNVNKIDQAISILQAKISTLENQNTITNIELIISEIKRLSTRLEELQETINSLSSEEEIYSDVRALLSDDGVKRSIINKYLPFLENKINYWLGQLDMFAKVTISDDLVETIKLRGFDKVRFDACSQGEQAKLTLAAVFAFRELLDIKNNSISNLLFLDEIIENIAYDGKIQLFRSLKGISTETGLSVFVVSHSNIVDEVFHEKWEVYKHGNFSKVKVLEV